MRTLTDRSVVHLEVAPDGTHHHFTRVHANSNLYRNSLSLLNACGILFHRFLHSERSVTGAHRVVLMRQRRAKERHYSITHDLIDSSLIAVHRLHHVFEDWVKEFPR